MAQASTARPSIEHLEPVDPVAYPEAPRHYGLLFWNNANGILEGVPTDAFWAWGLNDELIFVAPSLDLVVVRGGPKIEPHGFGDIPSLGPFFSPIARSVIRPNAAPRVGAGPDRRLAAAGVAALDGGVAEDGLPGDGITVAWSRVSGPAPVDIDRPGRLVTTAAFTVPGTYVMRLTVGDGRLTGADEATVTVGAAR